MIATCSPGQASEILKEGACQCIDVREYPEFAGGHVPGARLMPLGQVERRAGELDRARQIVILCKGGKRAAKAAEILDRAGCEKLTIVEGGTDAWIAAGFSVEKQARAPWALERQVRLIAGMLVLAGLFIPPWPWLSLAVGAGLVFAALTNTCAMGLLLAKMPWNRGGSGACCTK